MINKLIKHFEIIESVIDDVNSDKYNALVIFDMVQYLKRYLREDAISLLKPYENKKFIHNGQPLTIVHIKSTYYGLSFRTRLDTGLIQFLKYPQNLIEIK